MDKTLTTGATAAQNEAATSPETSRALVVTAPRRAAANRRPVYRPALFLAHLIAVKDKHPQTRERRRAEPAEALSAYRRALAAAR